MTERRYEYCLGIDDELVRVVFIHRSCCCNVPGCVDDEIQIYEDEDDAPLIMQVPRLMTPYLEFLFEKENETK